jgi:hypothetical protein
MGDPTQSFANSFMKTVGLSKHSDSKIIKNSNGKLT